MEVVAQYTVGICAKLPLDSHIFGEIVPRHKCVQRARVISEEQWRSED